MNSTLQQAIVGEPELVTLGGKPYPIAYPVQAVILYQAETAKIDRARRAEKLQSGGARLTREEIKDLRRKRRELIREAYALVPQGEDAKWDPDAFESFSIVQDESTAIKRELDEDRATGDSLYERSNWNKINPEEDSARFLLALWVGLHQWSGASGQPAKPKYLPALSQEELGPLIHAGNAEELGMAIAKALTAHILAPKTDEDEDPLPNAPPPAATPAEMEQGIVPGHPEMTLTNQNP